MDFSCIPHGPDLYGLVVLSGSSNTAIWYALVGWDLVRIHNFEQRYLADKLTFEQSVLRGF